MKIMVAMSGGVDSSVVAHKLKEEGHDLIGVMMKLWVDPLAPEVRRMLPSKCCSIEHINRARTVCESLGMPFYVMNLEEDFKSEVVDPFIEDYQAGKTPNPCINCNRDLKFGRLLQKMKDLGCEKLATGHYAKVMKDDQGVYHLHEATDLPKDQSYYLYGLSQEQLSNVIFPLGDLHKTETFALAQKYNVPMNSDYHESQDLCFFPEKEPKEFLKRYITDMEPGDIKLEDGSTVGTHEGLPLYTIGQRRGLGIGGLIIPLHVVRKETDTNTIIVAPNGSDHTQSLEADALKWIYKEIDRHIDFECIVRISSHGQRCHGVANHNGETLKFVFSKPIRGIAAGQSIVLYNEDEILGGGVIV
ncbi:tRNA 2-thiouridine(34) synthase MnmA [Candidatus Peregrinibacteria bacterium CG10_big_fil_rev_8_21_14_0_10_42_8]|nr:MAG: tRNA 2-thiouridine(34) synthase MnmA [Candidatus Peregrinibacteria bacterium CG10_big_fil_rev_8_21_14_0_10_42_8]